ncbi:MAG: MFS transporter, partial [Candidatus Thorarchaeota archaeon]
AFHYIVLKPAKGIEDKDLMDMSRTASFLGFTDADDQAIHLGKILMFLLPTASIIFMLSSTFYTIFVAEALGSGDFIQGLGLLGILVSIQMVVQTLLDYPSGALGDWIGQRWVIGIGNMLYGVMFFMVSFVTSETPFLYLVALFAIQGIAQSQISGAWSAWFDNNYRVAMPNDTERKQYGVFWGRMGMISQIAATLVLIPGSILAVVFQRPIVFQMQAVGAVFFALLVLRFIRDLPEVDEMREERPSLGEYYSLLGEGIRYLWRTPFVKYLVLGSCLAASAISVWGQLILFPLYYSYLITDVAVASFRTLAFIPGVAANERSGVWSQRFEPKKWIPRFRLLQACGFTFYIILAVMMSIFPPIETATEMFTLLLPFTSFVLIELPVLHVIPISALFTLFTITMFFSGFADILTSREMLDAIPDRNRNSIYSLQPTILLLLSIPQIAIIGWLIPLIGFPMTLILCAGVSLSGVLVIRYSLSLEKPIAPVERNGDDTAIESIHPLGESETDIPLDEVPEEIEQVITERKD